MLATLQAGAEFQEQIRSYLTNTAAPTAALTAVERDAIIEWLMESDLCGDGDYEEAWSEASRETSIRTVFDVYFCGSDEVTFSLNDWRSQVSLLRGNCGFLAYFAHNMVPLPFVVFTSSGDDEAWRGHVGLLVGEGSVLDASGVRSYDDVVSAYGVDVSREGAVRVVDVDEYQRIMHMGDVTFNEFTARFDRLSFLWMQRMATEMLTTHLR